MPPSTIMGINQLSEAEKRQTYAKLIPTELLHHFSLSLDELCQPDNPQLVLQASHGAPSAELSLFHEAGFRDPVLYGHLADTLNGQFHILLYILNNPAAARFDVDVLPDGTPTRFGTFTRNLEAEKAALQAGLAPGQIRRGLRMLDQAILAFESFAAAMEHSLFFVEPLHYHNAIIFERYGFAYQSGKRLMEQIAAGFSNGGELALRLDGSSPFRQPEAATSIRLRSWAIHDGILGEPFSNVTMYKNVGKMAGISTCNDCIW